MELFLSKRISKTVAIFLVWQMLVSPVSLLAANVSEVAAPVTLTVDESQQGKGLAESSGEASKHVSDKARAYEFGNNLLNYYVKEGKSRGPSWLKTTDFTLRFSENGKPVYSLETLLPLTERRDREIYWFGQGRYAHEGDNSTANVGLVWRKLSPDKNSMIGFNSFYDHSFQYNLARLGLGAEYFNKLAEYRLNYYYPLSGDKQTGVSYLTNGASYSYIRAVEGFDVEAGTWLTNMPWLRLSLGGYYWDNKHHDDEVGYKLESKLQLAPRINMNLGYSHSNLNHSFYGEIKYQLADNFGPSLFGDKKNKEENPAPQSVSDKLWQKVERDNTIKTETFTKFVSYSGNIRTTLTNSLNNTSIAGAQVQAYQNGTPVGSTVTTDADGSALITGLAVGTYMVDVTYSTYTGTSSLVTVTKDATTEASVSLAVHGGTVSITVLDSQSQPLSNVKVTAVMRDTTIARAEKSIIDKVLGVKSAYAGSSSFSMTSLTDANGEVRMNNLPPGSYLLEIGDGTSSMQSQNLSIEDGRTKKISLMLTEKEIVLTELPQEVSAEITVTVSDGQDITPVFQLDGKGSIQPVKNNNKYTFSGLSAGKHTITVAAPNYQSASIDVEIKNDAKAIASITLTRSTGSTGSAAVTITFSDGVTNVTPIFTLDGNTTITGVAGAATTSVGASVITYTFTNLPLGNHTIAAANDNYTSSSAATVTATTGTPVPGSIILTRNTGGTGSTGSAAVTVTFSDGATNVTPAFTLDGSTIIAGTAGVPAISGGASVITYTFTNLPLGSHTIVAADDNYISSSAATVTATTGTPMPGSIILIRKTETGSAAVTVTFSDGATNVTPIFTLDGSTIIAGTAGEPVISNGASVVTYTFANLPVGSHTIMAADDDYSSSSAATFTATTGTPTPVSITLTRNTGGTGSAAVTVTFSDGATNVTPKFTLDGNTITGTAGTPGISGSQSVITYTFTNLTLGSHTIVVANDNYTGSPASVSVTAVAGTPTAGNVTLTRKTGTGSAAVTVTFSDGATNVTPTFTLDGNTITGTAGTPGISGSQSTITYTFTNIPLGSYTIAATDSYYTSSGTANVTATAGTPTAGSIILTRKIQTGSAAVTITFSDGATNVTPKFTLDGSTTPITGTAGTPQVNGTTSVITYTFTNIPLGSHTIAAANSNYTSSGTATVSAVAGTPISGNITLVRKVQTGSALIKVTFSDGERTVTPTFTVDGSTTITGKGSLVITDTGEYVRYSFNNLSLGTHTIVASSNLYTSDSGAIVNVVAGKENVGTTTLTRKTGNITIFLNPGYGGVSNANVSVSVNGVVLQSVGSDSGGMAKFYNIPIGLRTFTVEKAGYATVTQAFTINTGNNVGTFSGMVQQFGSASITIKESGTNNNVLGAQVQAGNITIDAGTNSNVANFNSILIGTYTFVARKSGYADASVNLTISNNTTSYATITMTPVILANLSFALFGDWLSYTGGDLIATDNSVSIHIDKVEKGKTVQYTLPKAGSYVFWANWLDGKNNNKAVKTKSNVINITTSGTYSVQTYGTVVNP